MRSPDAPTAGGNELWDGDEVERGVDGKMGVLGGGGHCSQGAGGYTEMRARKAMVNMQRGHISGAERQSCVMLIAPLQKKEALSLGA